MGEKIVIGIVVAVVAVVAFLGGSVLTVFIIDNKFDRPPLMLQNAKPTSVKEIYQKNSPSIAYITDGKNSGSGFLISEDEVLTNYHVIKRALEGEPLSVSFKEDGSVSEAEVVGYDQSNDLALLHVNDIPSGLQPLQFANSDQLVIGDEVVAIGNPFGLQRTATTGIISALHRSLQAPDGFLIAEGIQTDAAINPGNSGGPLFNAAGEVIGINTQIISTSGQSSGVGLAVPSNTAQELLSELREGGAVEHGYLGVSGKDFIADDGSVLGPKIAQVFSDGPAANRLQPGDLVLSVNGRPVNDMSALQAQIGSRFPDDQIILRVQRGEQKLTIKLRLDARPQ